MSFLQAIVYFVREACSNLARSWKIALLAVATIAVSLFLGGVFLLLSGNLRQLVAGWQGESALVVYLEAAATPEEAARLARELEETPWVLSVTPVSAETARRRFSQAFPSLRDLLEGWGEDPLPASIEVRLAPGPIAGRVAGDPDLGDWGVGDRVAGDRQELDAWLADLRRDPAVSMLDDDRDWLRQLEAVVLALELLGLAFGAILLATAVFTISSVIRLTAYLYRDEIAVMRMVGATEFFIRGPFYMEGLLQGLAGGLLATGALAGAHALLLERYGGATLSLLAAKFLSAPELLALVALGGLAGLVGAIASLRRETLGQTAEAPEWEQEG